MLNSPGTAVAVSSRIGAARSALVIFNPTAGRRRRQRLRRALARLTALGVTVTVRETTAAGDARAFARDAAGVDIVVVAGGDGTINEAANGLAGRAGAPALAIVPLGTANVLAAELGFVDMSPEAAADAIAGGAVRPAWLGVANGRVFCQMAGVGFDAHVVAGIDVGLKRRIGKLAYVVETLRQLIRYRPRLYAVEIDGVRHVTASAVIANGHFYAGRYTCAPDASIDTPDLKVCLFTRAGRWHVIRYALGLFAGRLHRFADVWIVAGSAIRIAALADDGAVEPVQGDGDVITTLPVEISVASERLDIVRPLR
jgi:YegS/Rv2252/BmrU family lipid kinase